MEKSLPLLTLLASVSLLVALSAQAVRNLGELAGGFDKTREAARKRWNKVLGRLDVETPDVDRKRMFYTCLYRAALFPRAFWELHHRTEGAEGLYVETA